LTSPTDEKIDALNAAVTRFREAVVEADGDLCHPKLDLMPRRHSPESADAGVAAFWRAVPEEERLQCARELLGLPNKE